MEKQSSATKAPDLQAYLSPLAVWALSVGSAIGWGSLVVTSQTYLPLAGFLGSILGLLIGLGLMLMVAWQYHFLANRYPGAGGLYSYVKYIFGYDRAFLVAWFMFLTYVAIFWANATSIPFFAKYFFHGVLRVGYLYTIFGYEVYLGEALITLVVIFLVALFCMNSKKVTAYCIELLVLLFTIGITVCFVAVCVRRGGFEGMGPAFVPDKNALQQVFRIAFISPWAFIGFETVSHSAAEYRFKHSLLFRILALSLVVVTALYIFAIVLSVSAYPEGCSSWMDYIARLDTFDGIAGLPVFFAIHHYLGNPGLYILMASLMALVLTSLIGTLHALSRLCYSVAQDQVLAVRFSKLSDKQIPVNAILLVVFISIPIPFLGRTTIGWIVDTTTIGAVILYGFACAAVYKVAREENGRKKVLFISSASLATLVLFLALLLFPEYFADRTIGTETYVLMTIWSILGLLFFNGVIRKDHARNFGKAIIVWIALLAFIVVMSMTWMERMNVNRGDAVIDEIASYYDGSLDGEAGDMDEEDFLAVQREQLHEANNASVLAITILFGLSLTVLLANYLSMNKWERKAVEERDHAHEVAFRDALTGVKSKHAFSVQEGQVETQIRDGEAESFGVIVCDVNGLKRINDTLGHKAGDAYIQSCCKMLCDYYSHSPVFRIGGDEFVVLLQGQDYEERLEILQAINGQIEQNVTSGGTVISLGLAEYQKERDTTFHEVFMRADAQMYERKTALKKMGADSRD